MFLPDIDVFREKERDEKHPGYTRSEIFEEIFKGGFPDYILRHIDRETFFKSYLETYLTKDVRLLISDDNETTFRHFLSYVALSTGNRLRFLGFRRRHRCENCELFIDSRILWSHRILGTFHEK